MIPRGLRAAKVAHRKQTLAKVVKEEGRGSGRRDAGGGRGTPAAAAKGAPAGGRSPRRARRPRRGSGGEGGGAGG